MQQDPVHQMMRHLDQLSDAQLVALTFPRDGLRIRTPAVVHTRYTGSQKLPPGPPNGIHQREDGRLSLTKVAIVRVQPDTHIALARQLFKKGTIRIIAFGAFCGLLMPPIALTGWMWWQHRSSQAVHLVSPPCHVSQISSHGVSCRVGIQDVEISVGKPFPDGRYQLNGVDLGQYGFNATRTEDHQAFLFLVEPPLPISYQGASKK